MLQFEASLKTFQFVVFINSFRQLQNQNSKIGPKKIYSILPCFFLYLENKNDPSDSERMRDSTSVLYQSAADIQHVETRYFDRKDRYLGNTVDIWMVRDRFSKIKTNFWQFHKFDRILNFDEVWWVMKKLLKQKSLRNILIIRI